MAVASAASMAGAELAAASAAAVSAALAAASAELGGGWAARGTALAGWAAPATLMWMLRNVNVAGGWGHYGAGAVAAGAVAGAVAGLAIGATIASLPAAAQPLDVGGQTYYYDGTNYYQPCAQGSDMNYCVVSDPN